MVSFMWTTYWVFQYEKFTDITLSLRDRKPVYPELPVKELYARFHKKEIKYVVIQNICGTTALFDVSAMACRMDLYNRLKDHKFLGIRGWRSTNSKREATTWLTDFKHPPNTRFVVQQESLNAGNHEGDEELKLGESNLTVEEQREPKCIKSGVTVDEIEDLLGKFV